VTGGAVLWGNKHSYPQWLFSFTGPTHVTSILPIIIESKAFFSSPVRRPWELMPWRSVRRPTARRQRFPLNDH